MKRLTIFTVIIFVFILLINYVYYTNMYQKQISYIKDLLGQQVAIIGSEVNNTNITFESDLNEIIMEEDFANFFNNEMAEVKERIIEKFKFYYTKYDNFVETIEYDGLKYQVFMLYKDMEDNEWISNTYLAQDQKEFLKKDEIRPNRNKWDLVMPIYNHEGVVTGNIIITVDYISYFNNIFKKYKLEDQQWQWLVDEEGKVAFSNYFDDNIANKSNITDVNIRNLKRISDDITEGINSNIEHFIEVNDDSRRVISSYYSVELLRRGFGMVFSAPADFYQIYIIRNSLMIVSLTVILITILILQYRRHIRRQTYGAKRLKDSEQSFIRLIELLPVGVVVVGRNNKILKSNASAAAMFEYRDEKDMEGKMLPETEHSGQGLFFAESLGEGFEPNHFMVVNRQGVNNVLYRKEISVAFRGEESTMIVLMDVTLLDVARKQEAKAKEIKSEFLTKVSHEIKTPLNGIIGMVDMLTDKTGKQDTDKIISLIKDSSDLLQETINDLLDFSKIEEGKLVLEEIPFEIRKEIEYCFNVASTLVEEEVKLNWEVDNKVPESIIGDPFRLRKVITNLLSSSLEHTKKGQLRLDVKTEKANKGVVSLRFILRDTGKGYDNEILKRMYEDSEELDSSSISEIETKALGSLLSKRLIQIMGGNLKSTIPSGLSDDPEYPGIRFEFTISMYSNIRTCKDYGSEKVRKYSDIKTLVVSGSRQRDEELLNALHKYGIVTYVTNWQKQTVNLIKSNLERVGERYKSIIIVDAPDFDGFDVAKTLWENELYTSFMILMVSSNDKRGNYTKCIQYGVDDYLVKPYDASELINIINERFPDVKPETELDLTERIKKDLNILVVEDNLINQKVAETILKSIGFEVDMAINGKEGFSKAQKKKYDIVFMDLIMPEMDGYTASKKILKNSPGTIIIALSADSTFESEKKAEIAGISQFISKPVKKEDIKEILIKYFSN